MLFSLYSFISIMTIWPVAGWAQTSYTGKLSDGQTDYNLLVPDNWNGTLLASLDTMGPGDVRNWLLAGGYALAGTARGPAGWNLTYAATNIIEAMDKFETLVGKPTRTIIWGRSRGGITARAALQLFPDRFDGGIPMCGGGAGTVAMWNFKLDTTFALDVLLGSQYGIKLQLNNITDLSKETADINQIVTLGRQTPEGRARIALAAAFSQISTWNSPSQPEPAADDYEAQANNQASQIALPSELHFSRSLKGWQVDPLPGTMELIIESALSSGYEKLVKEMYRRQVSVLEADLKKLERAQECTRTRMRLVS